MSKEILSQDLQKAFDSVLDDRLAGQGLEKPKKSLDLGKAIISATDVLIKGGSELKSLYNSDKAMEIISEDKDLVARDIEEANKLSPRERLAALKKIEDNLTDMGDKLDFLPERKKRGIIQEYQNYINGLLNRNFKEATTDVKKLQKNDLDRGFDEIENRLVFDPDSVPTEDISKLKTIWKTQEPDRGYTKEEKKNFKNNLQTRMTYARVNGYITSKDYDIALGLMDTDAARRLDDKTYTGLMKTIKANNTSDVRPRKIIQGFLGAISSGDFSNIGKLPAYARNSKEKTWAITLSKLLTRDAPINKSEMNNILSLTNEISPNMVDLVKNTINANLDIRLKDPKAYTQQRDPTSRTRSIKQTAEEDGVVLTQHEVGTTAESIDKELRDTHITATLAKKSREKIYGDSYSVWYDNMKPHLLKTSKGKIALAFYGGLISDSDAVRARSNLEKFPHLATDFPDKDIRNIFDTHPISNIVHTDVDAFAKAVFLASYDPDIEKNVDQSRLEVDQHNKGVKELAISNFVEKLTEVRKNVIRMSGGKNTLGIDGQHLNIDVLGDSEKRKNIQKLSRETDKTFITRNAQFFDELTRRNGANATSVGIERADDGMNFVLRIKTRDGSINSARDVNGDIVSIPANAILNGRDILKQYSEIRQKREEIFIGVAAPNDPVRRWAKTLNQWKYKQSTDNVVNLLVKNSDITYGQGQALKHVMLSLGQRSANKKDGFSAKSKSELNKDYIDLASKVSKAKTLAGGLESDLKSEVTEGHLLAYATILKRDGKTEDIEILKQLVRGDYVDTKRGRLSISNILIRNDQSFGMPENLVRDADEDEFGFSFQSLAIGMDVNYNAVEQSNRKKVFK